ncbi:hypothetical protein [Paludibaculum fermentans]|uniref:hypothetical protein n=1 Tax=Paludibaculum fermentans TaxID=1473598 RepID=UPI003EBFE6EC
MAGSGKKLDQGAVSFEPPAAAAVSECRVATTDPDLVVLRTGNPVKKAIVPARERASGVLKRVGKAMMKPGADRARVFASSSGKPVYAYSLYTKDPTKIVREDASGRRTIGRFVGGRFRPTTSTE